MSASPAGQIARSPLWVEFPFVTPQSLEVVEELAVAPPDHNGLFDLQFIQHSNGILRKQAIIQLFSPQTGNTVTPGIGCSNR